MKYYFDWDGNKIQLLNNKVCVLAVYISCKKKLNYDLRQKRINYKTIFFPSNIAIIGTCSCLNQLIICLKCSKHLVPFFAISATWVSQKLYKENVKIEIINVWMVGSSAFEKLWLMAWGPLVEVSNLKTLGWLSWEAESPWT